MDVCKTIVSPFFWTFLFGKQKIFLFFGFSYGLFYIGRARHPWPGPRSFTPGQLSIEFVNVGGWLTSWDLALDSCVGVVSLGGAPLFLPSFVTPQFEEFFRLGRVLRTTLPTAQGGAVHLFVVYGYQVVEGDAEKLQLIDRLLQAVLAEAQVVCIGQPMLIAGDLNADPAVVPCLSKRISSGRYVDLALAYSLGAGLAPDVTCRFSREDGTGSRRDFFVGCPNALAASQACYVTDRWFTPHFSFLARFRVGAWMADVACPVVCQPLWPACWLNTPDRSSSSSTRVVQDVWDVYRDELGVVPEEVVLALRGAVSRSSVDDFWSICGEGMLRRVHFGPILMLEVPLKLAALLLLAEVCHGFVAGVWEAEL